MWNPFAVEIAGRGQVHPAHGMEPAELLNGFAQQGNVRCDGVLRLSPKGGIDIMSARPLPMQLDLTTQRLLLRPLRAGDADMLWPDITDPEISRLMAWDAHTTKEQTAAFVENEVARRLSGNGVTWAILMDGRFCGIVSLIGIQRTHRVLTYDKAELAYWVGRSHQRLGIMTEAGRAVLAFAFGQVGLHKVYVSHFAGNEASCSLIRGLGFRYVGTQLDEFQKDGVWHDHVMYELLDREHAAIAEEATTP
ncbi:GNAT family N-acetyltransferase [Bosea sp. (in: a-proteobacteria)]|jgi:RimJ/RimL family protein N-acetyltransferase|uniref:GNAT family N-acetyltransferase n=1 Tax=Bosea sp. (in: a-proteobacteria) TaxID=1871050 RepID=UPI0035613A53